MKLNFHENHKLLFLTVFIGYLILSFIIGIGPAIKVQNKTALHPDFKSLSKSEERGLFLYVSEGCLYCHTQQVRPLEMDKPYGRPSAPGDFAHFKPIDIWRFTPSTLGTQRTGPDLSNIGKRQPSETWHYIHLYNPRAVVEDSMMQAYPWLFELKENASADDIVVPVPEEYLDSGKIVVAASKAKDLVAYLLSLKQTKIQGYDQKGTSRISAVKQSSKIIGEQVYIQNCSSCHQPNGEGIKGVFPPLKNDSVVTATDPTLHIEVILFGLKGKKIDGVDYTSEMPAHADVLTDDEIASVINYERTSWGNSAIEITSDEVKAVRNKQIKQ